MKVNPDPARAALISVNHISAMVAYWDRDQRCIFSNDAYREWFGKTPQEMVGMSMRELLGSLYELNLPYIQGVLKGEKQVFERRITLPNSSVRDTIATYTPEIVNTETQGFWVHVADVSLIREREAALERTIRERDAALAEIRTLRGLLPICGYCKNIRDDKGYWHTVEQYIAERSDANFSHGICPRCMTQHFPDIKLGNSTKL